MAIPDCPSQGQLLTAAVHLSSTLLSSLLPVDKAQLGYLVVLQPQTFGDPLFMRISDGETLSEFKPRVQALLGVSDDEFARWKFCFNTSLRPTGKFASPACPGITSNRRHSTACHAVLHNVGSHAFKPGQDMQYYA